MFKRRKYPFLPLLPEQLNYLIYDKNFEKSLSKRMIEVKDFFVFGCTVALRFSDLIKLRKTNIRTVNGRCYLILRAGKTNSEINMKLPTFAIEIIEKYKKQKVML